MHRTLRTLGLVAVVALIAVAPAHATSQAEAYVVRNLPAYVDGVDVSTLTNSQIAALYLVMTDSGSTSDTRNQVRSIVFGLGRVTNGLPRLFP